MKTSYLCLERKKSKKRLLILDGEALDRYCVDSAEPYRISPIFPVVPNEAALPKNEGNYVVSFFVFDKPYSAIAALIKSLPPKHHGNLWFSHGLCSLIAFSKDTELPEQIRFHTTSCTVRAYEVWKIHDSKIKKTTFNLSKPEPFNQADFTLDYTGFPSDITAIISELTHSLNTAVRRSSQFLPQQLEVFKRLAKALRDILLELRFLHHTDSSTPTSFSERAIKEIRESTVKRQKMIHQRIGDLVQINSALTYVISQGFTGTVPLFESDCHTRAFSFLGIGSAYRALAAFSRFTESIFQDNPVDEVISKEFHKLQAFRVETNPSDHQNNVKGWDNDRWSVDTYIEGVKKEEKKLNLVYFSGRLGFRESEFAITAALQVLTNAGTASWSLMTFTHEMMHAHVRGILAAIFADTSKQFQFETLPAIFDRFNTYLGQSPGQRMPETFLESLRFQILAYCGYRRILRIKLAEQARTGKFKFVGTVDWDMSEIAEEFSLCNREINEIFVHVLDFNYFYNGKAKNYLSLLWQSWLPVPVVLEDVQNYIWRSLLALASQHSGEGNARFDAALDLFTNTLSHLNDAGNTNVLIQHALEFLKDKNNRSILLFRFVLALPLVDMIQAFLCASHIYGELFDDDNGIAAGDDYIYALETGAFKELALVSPISLAADRLYRALSHETTKLDDAHIAAWFFLACSECERKKKLLI